MPAHASSRNGAVQLVVTDLDGTLSDAQERIHPASARAIRELVAGGVPVLVATGRRLRMAAAVLQAGGVAAPATGSRSRPRRPARCSPRSWPRT
jgi:hydroxymethylpyrimidine pyrophosphatase-like HAD family hydrolase